MENERKTKIISLIAVIVAVLGLTLAFAAMSRTLRINGTGAMDPVNWEIYFDNLSNPTEVGEGTATGTPTLATKGATISNMNVTLKKPGDSVTYTVDIVNDGDIDAEINDITITPSNIASHELLDFSVVYTGTNTSPAAHDMLASKETKNITITFSYKDITDENKLPKSAQSVTVGYEIEYVQSNTKVTTTTTQVSAVTYQVGDKICLNNEVECFYVLTDNGSTVTALAEWNLNVGSNKNPNVTEGIQHESIRGNIGINNNIGYGNLSFSEINYWDENESLKSSYGSYYPAWVFDSNSNLWTPVQNYQTYLRNTLGKTSVSVTLMSYEQADAMGCSTNNNNCNSAPSWVYQTAYWLGTAMDFWDIAPIAADGSFLGCGSFCEADQSDNFGVRPVITIAKSDL